MLPARLAVLFAAALLSACGFQLAGKRPLPAALTTVFIEMNTPYQVEEPPLQTSLRRALERRGAVVLATGRAGETQIQLSNLQERRETLSIGPDGKALEYRLVLSVDYSVRQGERVLLAPDRLSVQRDYSFAIDQILAKEAEEAQLRTYIQGEMAELLLLRMDAALAPQGQ